MFMAALFTIAKSSINNQMSINNQTDKENVAHIYKGEGNGTPLQISYLRNPMIRGAWHATIHRVAKNWI